MADQEKLFHPQDAIGDSVRIAGITTALGFAGAAVQNALAKSNVGTLGVFTRSGSMIVMCTLSGAGYGFFKGAAANLRRKNDSYNEAIGGFAMGNVIGMTVRRSLPAMLGYGAAVGAIVAAFDYTGGKLSGFDQDPNVDHYARKIALRENRRRPIQETIDELGEGRGIYGPGYAERRRERIKQAYGIDVGEQGRGVETQ